MIQIVICDDERFTCSNINEIVLDYCKQNNIEVKVNVFNSGEEICKFIDKGNKIDILFLDIELDKLSGVEVGKYIRDSAEDEHTKIIYISSKESYAMQLFKIRPFDFLLKPISSKDIQEVLGQVIKILEKENNFFEYYVGKVFYRIKINEILYFYSEAKKLIIVTKDVNKKIEFYGKLKELRSNIGDGFLSIHKSYLVNFDAIVEYKYDSVKLINGQLLPISQANRNNVREEVKNKARRG